MDDATRARLKELKAQAPIGIDYCHGMVGGPAILWPNGVIGFMQGADADRKAEALANDLRVAWALGYMARESATKPEPT